MTLYVAARYTEKGRARAIRAALVNAGYAVTSRWLHAPEGTPLATAAREDLEDIRQSHALGFVQAKPDPRGMRGAYVEVGYALALGLPILVLDESDPDETSPNWTVFWSLPRVTVFPSLDRLLCALPALAWRQEEGPIA